MTKRWMLGLLLFSLACPAEAGPVKVSGRVIGTDGKPAARVEVSRIWDHSGGRLEPLVAAKTDADGRFTMPLEFYYGRPHTLMAADEAGELGGLATVEAAKAADPVEIRLAPLARVRGEFVSEDPAFPVTMVGVYVLAGKGETGVQFAQFFNFDMVKSRASKGMPETSPKFELRLPPGDYDVQCYIPMEPAQHLGTARPVTIAPDQAGQVRDLGQLELKLHPLAKLQAKPAPPLRVKDARGVAGGKDVRLADFRGKYVLLEFWTTTCGPCIGRALPDLMDLYDEHEADRDKFVILAVHGAGADDFADLDKKLVPIVRDTWDGRRLPFPTLLDDDGRTFEAYGVSTIPVTVLIDPKGNIVPGGIEALRHVLPEVPVARRLPRALERQPHFALDEGGAPLAAILEHLGDMVRIEIKLDPAALARLGIKADANVPLTLAGKVSLRSWLDLVLRPFGLVAVPGPGGLVATTPDPSRPRDEAPSDRQRLGAERIGKKLDEMTSFDFATATLAEVARHLGETTGESFVLDPTDRRAGRLDPASTVTGQAKDIPLRDALKALLAPVGVEVVVRDEVVLLTKPRP